VLSVLIPTLGAVIPAVVTALIGIVSYRNQKQTDLRVELRNRRMEECERCLTAYANYAVWVDTGNSNKARRMKNAGKNMGSVQQLIPDRFGLCTRSHNGVSQACVDKRPPP